MKNLPIRLENAITKLYNAFHSGELNAFNCKMCAVGSVIEYLCELDNIPNVMDIQSLFEYENNAPKKKLIEVL